MAVIHPNREGQEEILRSPEIAKAVNELAEQIAERVRAQGIQVEGEPGEVELPVEVEGFETDRARGSVFLAHPSGLAVQAKHGALTRAAAELGLTVN